MLHCQLWALKNNKSLKYNELLNLPGDFSVQGTEWSNFQIFPWKNESQELAFLSNKFSCNPGNFKTKVSQKVLSVMNLMEKTKQNKNPEACNCAAGESCTLLGCIYRVCPWVWVSAYTHRHLVLHSEISLSQKGTNFPGVHKGESVSINSPPSCGKYL